MQLLKELKIENYNKIANLVCKVGLCSLYFGLLAITVGIFISFYIRNLIPVIIGIVILTLTYLLALNLLIQAKSLEMQDSIDSEITSVKREQLGKIKGSKIK